MAIDTGALAAILSGYQQGREQQLRMAGQSIQNRGALLNLQNALNLNRASLGGIVGGAATPADQTIGGMSGGYGNIPAITPSMGSQPQSAGGAPGTQTTGAVTSAPSPYTSAPPQSSVAGAPPSAGIGGQTPPGSIGGFQMPMQGMTLGQMFQRLRADPKNAGIPDVVLFGVAQKAQAALNPDDRLLLQYILRQQPTPMQQATLGLKQQEIQDTDAYRKLMLQLSKNRNVQMTPGLGVDPKTNQQVPGAYIFDKNTGKITFTPTGGAMGPQAALTGSIQPDDPRVKAIANYQLPPGSQWGSNTPYATALQDAVLKANPNYDATQYAARSKVVNDFATGKEGNSVRSFNVAIQHLQTLDQAAQALKNGDVQMLNRMKQRFSQEFGSAVPTNFDAIKQIVGQEITKAIIAGGGGVTERQAASDILARWNSPGQTSGVISELEKLMAGQLNGLRQQYEVGTRLNDFDKFLLPSTISVMKGAGYGGAGGKSSPKLSSSDPLGLLGK